MEAGRQTKFHSKFTSGILPKRLMPAIEPMRRPGFKTSVVMAFALDIGAGKRVGGAVYVARARR
jgi:hypothetical protein